VVGLCVANKLVGDITGVEIEVIAIKGCIEPADGL